jgi:predicted metalloenzyme YecM
VNPFDQPLEAFLTRLFHLLDEAGVDVSELEMDHVCYRVETRERYERLKHAWRIYASDVHESPINGRPISVFTLMQPLMRCGRTVSLIELPAPKAGSHFVEGWEHAEFVLKNELFVSFKARHARELMWDDKGSGKDFNPELGLKFGQGIQAKFHYLPLSTVIQMEKRRGLGTMSEA